MVKDSTILVQLYRGASSIRESQHYFHVEERTQRRGREQEPSLSVVQQGLQL